MVTVNLKEVDYNFLDAHNGDTLKVYIEQLDFYFKVFLRKDSKKLVVFSNGAVDKNKKNPPVFMRSSWYEDIQANCLFIDDRTIHDSDLKIGWGIGSEERHYLKDYNHFVKHVCKLLEIKECDLLYFGSSAGGFMSIALASDNRGSKAVVNNPQTYVSRYHEAIVKKTFGTIFPGQTRKDILKNYSDRLSLVNIMARNKNIPETYYIQNRLCKSDITNHLLPLWENMDRYKLDSSNINFILYNNKRSGHNPIGREGTVQYINNILNGGVITLK